MSLWWLTWWPTKKADMEMGVVADMEVDKVVNIVADMLVYFDIKAIVCVFFGHFHHHNINRYHNYILSQ